MQTTRIVRDPNYSYNPMSSLNQKINNQTIKMSVPQHLNHIEYEQSIPQQAKVFDQVITTQINPFQFRYQYLQIEKQLIQTLTSLQFNYQTIKQQSNDYELLSIRLERENAALKQELLEIKTQTHKKLQIEKYINSEIQQIKILIKNLTSQCQVSNIPNPFIKERQSEYDESVNEQFQVSTAEYVVENAEQQLPKSKF
ncbi:Hypothetical_protein [Hexamita inflata]|uniref:Hypothetical_protein n=1 Tax=Hexamita inflata TaxID=28002 RepID=A0AA86P4C6_9EUKA|nr:Hypothetical protein HINF_LOCUS566 [Hexamita inflata]CAI9931561.1 Hypothetical protein HINF_LOCUS19206 [Hexamita inflata]CAI9950745.1 Hypothetical protein HINF_LOCUS38390 [Hexamita inflata]